MGSYARSWPAATGRNLVLVLWTPCFLNSFSVVFCVFLAPLCFVLCEAKCSSSLPHPTRSHRPNRRKSEPCFTGHRTPRSLRSDTDTRTGTGTDTMGGIVSSRLFSSKVVPQAKENSPTETNGTHLISVSGKDPNSPTELDSTSQDSPALRSHSLVSSSPVPSNSADVSSASASERKERIPSASQSEPLPQGSRSSFLSPDLPPKKASVALSDTSLPKSIRHEPEDTRSSSKRSPSLAFMGSPGTPSRNRFSFSMRNRPNKIDYADQITNQLLDRLVQDGSYSHTEYPKYIMRELNGQIRKPFQCGEGHGISIYDDRLGDKVCAMFMESMCIPDLYSVIGCFCLRNNNLTIRSLSSIYHSVSLFTCVKKIDISCNYLGDTGLKLFFDLFSNIITLTTVNVSYVGATDESVSRITAYMKECSNLLEFRLTSNLFTTEGLNTIIDAVEKCKNLYVIDLEGSPGYCDKTHKRLESILTKNFPSKPKNSTLDWECHPDRYTVSTGTIILPDGTLSVPSHISSVVARGVSIIQNLTWERSPMFSNMDDMFVAECPVPRPLGYISYTNEVIAAVNELSLKSNTLKSGRFRIGYSDTIGRRQKMEDKVVVIDQFFGQEGWCFVGLFDGHGGVDAALYASEQLPMMIELLYTREGLEADPASILHRAFIDVNESMAGFLFCGTTVLVALFIGDSLYMACAGDSRGIISRGGEVIRLSRDHKPTTAEEKVRIASVGGFVKDGRVNGVLSVSRSLGDSFLHPVVSSEPFLSVTQLHLPSCKSARNATQQDGEDSAAPEYQDEFLLLGCDGVWDVLGDYEAATIARFANYQQRPDLASEAVRNSAFRLGTADNVSVVIVSFAAE